MREPSFHQLLLFDAVARNRSFSRAAAELSLSQPTISHQIRALERALGVRLTERQGRGFRLTPAGSRVAAYAARLASLAEDLDRELVAIRGGLRDHLRIGAGTAVGEYLLPDGLARLRALYSGVTARVDLGNSPAIAERVLAGQLDVAFVGQVAEHPGLLAQIVGVDRVMLVVAPGHRLTRRRTVPDDLADEPYLARELGSSTRSVAEETLGAAGLRLTPILELASNDALKRAAAAGLGFVALSELVVRADLASGQLGAVDAPWFDCRRPLTLIQAAHRRLSPAGRALMELVPSVV